MGLLGSDSVNLVDSSYLVIIMEITGCQITGLTQDCHVVGSQKDRGIITNGNKR